MDYFIAFLSDSSPKLSPRLRTGFDQIVRCAVEACLHELLADIGEVLAVVLRARAQRPSPPRARTSFSVVGQGRGGDGDAEAGVEKCVWSKRVEISAVLVGSASGLRTPQPVSTRGETLVALEG